MELEIILFIILFIVLFLIYNNYKKPVNSRNYLLGIYSYISLTIILIAIFTDYISKYIKGKNLLTSKNYLPVYLISFIIIILAIIFIGNNNPIISHIALLVFILGISILILPVVINSPGIIKAIIITAIIIFILTCFTFLLSENGLDKLILIGPVLNLVLFILILLLIIYIIFFRSIFSRTINKYITIIIIGLFILFILSNTASIIKKSKNLTCQNQACINYPADSLGLSLDFIILFSNILNLQ